MKVKEHSNFVAALVNFNGKRTKGIGIVARFNQTTPTRKKIWTFKDCQSCNDAIKDYVVTKNMIRNEADLFNKLQIMQKRFEAAQSDYDKMCEQNNLFRTVLLAENPTVDTTKVENTSDTIDTFVASHAVTWDSFTIETRLSFLNIFQKMAEFFAVSISKERGKTDIKLHIKELRQNDVAKSAKIQNDIQERKEKLSPYEKMIAGIMKTSRVSREVAQKMVAQMGIQFPSK